MCSNKVEVFFFSHLKNPTKKPGGKQSPGPLGGIYKLPTGGEGLAKRESDSNKPKNGNIIAEYVVSRLFHNVYPDLCPEIAIAIDNTATPTKKEIVPDETGEKTYLISKIVPGAQDLFKRLGKSSRGYMWGSQEMAKDAIQAIFNTEDSELKKLFKQQSIINDISKIIVACLTYDDFDLMGNLLVWKDKVGQEHLIRFDFGASSANLGDEVKPHSQTERLPGINPSNHIVEVPEVARLSPETSKASASFHAISHDRWIKDIFLKEVKRFWGVMPIAEYAERIMKKKGLIEEYRKKVTGCSQAEKEACKNKLLGEIIKFYSDKIKKRQCSTYEYGLEIFLGNTLMEWKGERQGEEEEKKKDEQKEKVPLHKIEAFKEFIRNEINAPYIDKVLKNKENKEPHIRHTVLKKEKNKNKQIIRDALKEALKEINAVQERKEYITMMVFASVPVLSFCFVPSVAMYTSTAAVVGYACCKYAKPLINNLKPYVDSILEKAYDIASSLKQDNSLVIVSGNQTSSMVHA